MVGMNFGRWNYAASIAARVGMERSGNSITATKMNVRANLGGAA